MSLFSRLFSRIRTNGHSKHRSRRSGSGTCRPMIESLESRTVLSTTSSITASFNRIPIAEGDTIWFNSAFNTHGLGREEATIWVTDQKITFSDQGVDYTVDVPDSIIHFLPGIRAADATTTFDDSANAWVTNLPLQDVGDSFLGGVAFHVDTELSPRIRPVTWEANFTTDTEGVSLRWKWAAAVYTSFDDAPGVKPVDRRTFEYPNLDPAGTPEEFKPFLVGGARGGPRGSNYTGVYTPPTRVTPDVGTPPPPPSEGSSLSGYVYWDVNQSGTFDSEDLAFPGVAISLYDENGALVAETTTDDNGYYSFTGLAAGTYTIQEEQPYGFDQGANSLGSLGGSMGFDSFTVALALGEDGTDYNFGEIEQAPPS